MSSLEKCLFSSLAQKMGKGYLLKFIFITDFSRTYQSGDIDRML